MGEFVGIEIGKATVQQEQVAVASFEFAQRVGPAQGLLDRPAIGMKCVDDMAAEQRVGTGNQHATRRRRQACGQHRTHCALDVIRNKLVQD